MPLMGSKSPAMTLPNAGWAAVMLLILNALSARGAVSPWQSADAEARAIPDAERWVRPNKSRAYRLEATVLRDQLGRAPKEFTPAAAQAPAEISLPMPDGTLARFSIVESTIMAPELAAKYPEIKTWSGQGIDDAGATVRLDFPSSFEMLDLIQLVTDDACRRVRLDEEALHSVRVAVRESVINAIKHGNHNDTRKRVHVEFSELNDNAGPGVAIRVRDEGTGFDPSTIPDCLAPENILKCSGRGIFLIRSFMDELVLQKAPEGGMEVRMVKRVPHQRA